jgi:hypothetical protein
VPQPILRTPRLVLEPLADRHVELEIELDSDAEVITREEWLARQGG